MDSRTETKLSQAMLSRCAMQFSVPIPGLLEGNNAHGVPLAKQFETEKTHAIEFIRQHYKYAKELSRALVWRVMDTDDMEDTLGAWRLLVALYEWSSEKNDTLVDFNVLRALDIYLEPLLRAKWFTTIPPAPTVSTREQLVGRDHDRIAKFYENKNELYATSGTSRLVDSVRRVLMQFGPSTMDVSGMVVPNAASITATAQVNHGPGSHAGTGTVDVDPVKAVALSAAFAELADRWMKLLSHETATRYRRCMSDIAKVGPFLTTALKKHLLPPESFQDATWMLRRVHPRPSSALSLLRVYGWEMEKNRTTERPDGLPFASDIALLRPMHPKAEQWLRRLALEPSCVDCDSWKHTTKDCPAVMAVKRLIPQPALAAYGKGAFASDGVSPLLPLRNNEQRRALPSYRDAVRTLKLSGVANRPADGVNGGQKHPIDGLVVFDAIVTRILQEQPYEDLLLAFDTVRGFYSPSVSRSALWFLASYQLLPSAMLVDPTKPSESESDHTDAFLRVARFLQSKHRFTEYGLLEAFVEELTASLTRRRFQDVKKSLQRIVDHGSYLFCFYDGSVGHLDVSRAKRGEGSLTLQDYEEVEGYLPFICTYCASLSHTTASCKQLIKFQQDPYNEKPPEPWDWDVASRHLHKYELDRNFESLTEVEEAVRKVKREQILQDVLNSTQKKDYEARRMDEASEEEFERYLHTELMTEQRNSLLKKYGRLDVAVSLLLRPRVHYCNDCNRFGHSSSRCPRSAKKTLEKLFHMHPVEARLTADQTRQRVARELRQIGSSGEMEELEGGESVRGSLDRIMKVFCQFPNAYPSSFHFAITHLKAANVPLAACMYAPRQVEKFLIATSQYGLLDHVAVVAARPSYQHRHASLAAPKLPPSDVFPEVCVYCSSVVHHTLLCNFGHQHKDESEYIDSVLHHHVLSLRELIETIVSAIERSSHAVQHLLSALHDKRPANGYHHSSSSDQHQSSPADAALQAAIDELVGISLPPVTHPVGFAKLVEHIRNQLIDRLGPGGALRVAFQESQEEKKLHAVPDAADLRDAIFGGGGGGGEVSSPEGARAAFGYVMTSYSSPTLTDPSAESEGGANVNAFFSSQEYFPQQPPPITATTTTATPLLLSSSSTSAALPAYRATRTVSSSTVRPPFSTQVSVPVGSQFRPAPHIATNGGVEEDGEEDEAEEGEQDDRRHDLKETDNDVFVSLYDGDEGTLMPPPATAATNTAAAASSMDGGEEEEEELTHSRLRKRPREEEESDRGLVSEAKRNDEDEVINALVFGSA